MSTARSRGEADKTPAIYEADRSHSLYRYFLQLAKGGVIPRPDLPGLLHNRGFQPGREGEPSYRWFRMTYPSKTAPHYQVVEIKAYIDGTGYSCVDVERGFLGLDQPKRAGRLSEEGLEAYSPEVDPGHGPIDPEFEPSQRHTNNPYYCDAINGVGEIASELMPLCRSAPQSTK